MTQQQGHVPVNAASAAFNAALSAYAMGDMEKARAAALQTLVYDRAHPGALYMAGAIELARGAAAIALPYLEEAARLAPQHIGVLRALGMGCLQLDRCQESVTAFRAAIALGARDAELLNALGQALHELDAWDDAIAAYRDALALAPQDAGIYNNLAVVLNRKHDYVAATAAYEKAVHFAPHNVEIIANLAILYEQQNMTDKAREMALLGLVLSPQHGNLHLVLARCERRDGEWAAAIEHLSPLMADANLNLIARRGMEFELGRDFDALGDTERAYGHFLRGNSIAMELWPDMADGARKYLEELDSMLTCYTPLALRSLADAAPSSAGPAPVFLVSFPRSGTTLMDTILDAHPAVAVLEEAPLLHNVMEALRQMPGGNPAALLTLTPDQLEELRGIYWQEVDKNLGGERSHSMLVVDKNPFYSTRAALIYRLFPQARFIFALRHPCAVVLSCFMQSFGRNPVLANFLDLETSAATYRRVMDLWLRYRAALPLNIHELRYESLVEDKESQIRALLGFLDLEWSDAVGDHAAHARKRGRIYTPSYHQVIRPIYKDSVDRWRGYQHYFGPVMQTLEPYIREFGYEV